MRFTTVMIGSEIGFPNLATSLENDNVVRLH